MTTATLCFEVAQQDPVTRDLVELFVYKDELTGRYFAIDASYCMDEDVQVVDTPFGHQVELIDDVD